MIHSPDNLSIIIGASPRVDSLRRLLRQNGFTNLGIATSLPGLRRELIAGEEDLIVSCILLDETTIIQHGEALRGLLADAKGFSSSLISIGLVTDPTLMPEAMAFGCHFYLDDFDRIAPSIRALSGHWQDNCRQSERKTSDWHQKTPGRKKRVTIPNRLNSLSSLISPGNYPGLYNSELPRISRFHDWFGRNHTDPDAPG